MAVVAAHDESGAGQDVGPVAQRNQGSLGLAQACLQVAALAGLDRPLQPVHLVRDRRHFGGRAGTGVLTPGLARDPDAPVAIDPPAPSLQHLYYPFALRLSSRRPIIPPTAHLNQTGGSRRRQAGTASESREEGAAATAETRATDRVELRPAGSPTAAPPSE